jgi:uncharacterized LabA/DUF88 family protein
VFELSTASRSLRLQAQHAQEVMPSERVYVACDVSNLWHACRKEFGGRKRLDFSALSKYVPSLRHPSPVTQELVAYIVSHTKTNVTSFAAALQSFGYRVRQRHMSYVKAAKTLAKPFRTDWDIGITIDAIDKIDDYDTFVIISGDGDFGQLIDYLRHRRKNTIVMSFQSALSMGLYNHAHEVIVLDESVTFDGAMVEEVPSWAKGL